MAPQPRSASAGKGKARTYLCLPCGTRHPPPTGAACTARHRGLTKTRSTSTAAGPAKTRLASANTGTSQTRRLAVRGPGRPRKSVAPPWLHSEDDDDLQFLLCQSRAEAQRERRPRDDTSTMQVSGTERRPPALARNDKRAREDDTDVAAAPARKRPTPVPRHSILAPPAPVLSPSSTYSEPPSNSNELVGSLMSQISAMQQANQAQCERLARENQADREMFRQSIAQVNARMDHLAQQRPLLDSFHAQTQPLASTPAHSPDPRPSTSTALPTPAPRHVVPPPQSVTLNRDNPFPDGQPTIPDVTPRQLQQATDPAKALRANITSADVADRILKVVGILEESDAERGSKSGNGKRSKKKLAKWPSDYVYRLDDEEPAYDTLSAPEFVSGYLSITLETLPNITDNDIARGHMFYLRGLMEDCPELGWEAVRMAHKMVLNAIELKRLTWADTEAVQKLKTTAMQRVHRRLVGGGAPNIDSASKPCTDFQSLSCAHDTDHNAGTETLLHLCVFCYSQGKRHPHALVNCRKAKEGLPNPSEPKTKSKNSKPRAGKKPE